MLIVWAFLFIWGSALGSFLNVIIFRVPNKKSIVKNSSHCPHCQKPLSWYELIPILSFIIQAGKCRSCKEKISLQYPLIEMLMGFVSIISWQIALAETAASTSPWIIVSYLFFLTLGSLLVLLAVFDIKFGILPHLFIIPSLIITIIYLLITNSAPITHGLTAIGAGGFFATLILITKGKGMGGGDLKLAILIGLLLGWPKTLVALYLAFLFGAGVSLILMITKRKKLGQTIPFGPFLVISTFVALVWGNAIINWYQRLF